MLNRSCIYLFSIYNVFHPFRFSKAKRKFSVENQVDFKRISGPWIPAHRKSLEELGKILKFEKMEDWYKIKTKDFKLLQGGRSLLRYYRDSPSLAVETIFSEYDWKTWKFQGTPIGYWKNKKNQRQFLDYIGKELQIKTWTDWYSISASQFLEKGGIHLLSMYGSSLTRTITSIYKEFPWEMKNFKTTPQGYWNNLSYQRQHFDELAKHLGLNSWTDWYKVRFTDAIKYGVGPLHIYKYSLVKAILSVYPEHPWKIWKFQTIPHFFLDDEQIVRTILQQMKKELGLYEKQDWYEVTRVQLVSLKLDHVLNKYGGYIQVLQHFFPDENWDFSLLRKTKTQNILFRFIRRAFPNRQDIYSNYMHPDLLFADTQSRMQLDIFIPSLNIAFEYHGIQHYEQSEVYADSIDIQKRDIEKVKACERAGIALVVIPYWWDQLFDSFIATVYKIRPDLVPKPTLDAEPVPELPPKRKYWKNIQGMHSEELEISQ